MGSIAQMALKWHPLAVLLAYGGLLSGYCRYLDGSLKYVRPQIPAAPEDILGFGFWVPWILVALWFVAASWLSYKLALQRHVGYWVALVLAFGILSVTDFVLYGVLERQVLAG